MSTITQSGLYTTNDGIPFLITQGLVGYNLIAGKQCLLRIFTTPANVQQASALIVTIAGAGHASAIVIPSASWIAESAAPQGPSIGIIIRGFAFARPAQYSVGFFLLGGVGNVLVSGNAALIFTDTGDLRLADVSPCIDSGNHLIDVDATQAGFQLLPASDLAAKPRTVDGNGDGLAEVDMGAYEFQP
jgi:hypothetical protein